MILWWFKINRLDAKCKGPELTYETARDAIPLRNT
jgi:hypothetical protein